MLAAAGLLIIACLFVVTVTLRWRYGSFAALAVRSLYWHAARSAALARGFDAGVQRYREELEGTDLKPEEVLDGVRS